MWMEGWRWKDGRKDEQATGRARWKGCWVDGGDRKKDGEMGGWVGGRRRGPGLGKGCGATAGQGGRGQGCVEVRGGVRPYLAGTC